MKCVGLSEGVVISSSSSELEPMVLSGVFALLRPTGGVPLPSRRVGTVLAVELLPPVFALCS
jgi:hypothetical protein